MRHKSIKKNMIMSIILTFANFIFPLITYSYVARVLTPAGTGRVAFVNSILSYFSYIAILGIPAYGVREVAKVRDDKEKMSNLVQELLVLNTMSTAFSYFLLTLTVILVPKLYSEKMLFIVMGASIFLNTIGLEWVYQALEEYSYITIRSLAFKVISVILTFLLIRSEHDVAYYGFVHIFTSSASYLMNFFHVRKYVSFKKKIQYSFKRHIKPILTLFASSIIITIYANFDVSMIGFINTEYEVGLYSSAQKIKQIILSLSTAITAVLVPRMAYYLNNNDAEKSGQLIEKSLRVSMDLAVPVAIYVFVFAEDCLLFICGDEYLPAVRTLRILIACIIPLVFTNLFGNQILIPKGNEKRYSQSVFVGMWINLGLNALMIPKLGAFGAAIGTLVTECWNVFWMSGGARDYRQSLIRNINFVTYLLPMIIATSGSIIVGRLVTFSLFCRLVATGITFFSIYYFSLIAEKEPIVTEQLRSVMDKIFQKGKSI